MGDNETAALRVLAGIGGFSEGGVALVPRIEEGMAALFEPAVEVGGGDGVGGGEERIGGFEELDGIGFIDDALPPAHGQWKRGGEIAALVLDDEGATVADEGVEAGLSGGEF